MARGQIKRHRQRDVTLGNQEQCQDDLMKLKMRRRFGQLINEE